MNELRDLLNDLKMSLVIMSIDGNLNNRTDEYYKLNETIEKMTNILDEN
jgi:hypothetical protein